jgi:hypothetical protein
VSTATYVKQWSGHHQVIIRSRTHFVLFKFSWNVHLQIGKDTAVMFHEVGESAKWSAQTNVVSQHTENNAAL